MPATRWILASASPRRLDLLTGLGLAPEVVPAHVDETPRDDETPTALVARLAEAKARSVAATIGPDPGRPAVVLAADTEVVLDGRVLGKPRDDDGALAALRSLSGREHEVLSGICLVRLDLDVVATRVARTRVRFRPLEEALLRWYVATGEPRDKAGGYGIQERGALLVDAIDGSWSNVVGLPLEALPELAARAGLDLASELKSPARPARRTPRRP